MHIPDGYLSPQTCVPLWGAMLVIWARASAIVRRTVSSARLPLLAIGAAFSFVIMMFNVPIPGGTTGHAVGGALVTILLGPWAATVAISVALVVQALIFGDGGITAIAANCFTMAVVGTWVAWWVYRAVAGVEAASVRRRVWGAALAAYASLNASALATAVLFGIQPLIARGADGRPQYAPYPLAVAVPAVMIEHLLLFGFVEAVVTALAVRWFAVSEPELLTAVTGERPVRYRRLWIALGVLALLTPIGIWLPSTFGAGAAWGEWGSEELAGLVGFVPRGLARLGSVWNALLPDYAVPGLSGPVGEAVGYVVSAAVGLALVALAAWGVVWLARRAARARAGREDFVARTLARLADTVRQAMAQERTARADGWLQRLDARAKVVGGLALIVSTTLVRGPWPLAALYAATLVAAATSKVPVASALKRVWLTVPLFTGLIVLPATLNLITPGEPVAVLARLGQGATLGPWALPEVITVTREGIAVALLVLARVASAVAIAVLVTATTRWQELLAGLRALKVPSAFVMVAEMTYRYFFVLAGLARSDFLGRRSRTMAQPERPEARGFVAGRAGTLFRHSLELSRQVNLAMVSRGWDGTPRVLGERPLAGRDAVAAALATVLAAGMVISERVFA